MTEERCYLTGAEVARLLDVGATVVGNWLNRFPPNHETHPTPAPNAWTVSGDDRFPLWSVGRAGEWREWQARKNTQRLDGDDYMELLECRMDVWLGGRPASRLAPPLLTSFILPGDEHLVDMASLEPGPQPKRETQPRTYRSAESLRAQRDQVQAEVDSNFARGDNGDMASINIAPSSSNRRTAKAGRRRFAALDRDLERHTQLTKRLVRLDSRIAAAETREAKAKS